MDLSAIVWAPGELVFETGKFGRLGVVDQSSTSAYPDSQVMFLLSVTIINQSSNRPHDEEYLLKANSCLSCQEKS
jgi:hypothetical protein